MHRFGALSVQPMLAAIDNTPPHTHTTAYLSQPRMCPQQLFCRLARELQRSLCHQFRSTLHCPIVHQCVGNVHYVLCHSVLSSQGHYSLGMGLCQHPKQAAAQASFLGSSA